MAERQRSLWTDAFRRLRRDRLAIASLAIILLYGLVALGVAAGDLAARARFEAENGRTGGLLQAVAPALQKVALAEDWAVGSDDSSEWRQGPWKPAPADAGGLRPIERLLGLDLNEKHPFGTDLEGRDILARTLYGAKIALSVGLLVGLSSVIVGLVLGALAGYRPGWIDELIVWLYTTVDAIPYILLIVAFAFVLRGIESIGPLTRIWIAMTATFWTGTARVIRGEVIKQRDRDYVVAARALGAGGPRILFLHIVPNVLHLAIINFSLLCVGAIKNEVILSYLGLGVVDQPSWGILLDNAKMELGGGYWWQLTAATGAMFLLVLALNVFTDALRDALDPRLHR